MSATSPSSPVRIWSPRAVGLFAFFFSFPAGLALAVRNWRVLGCEPRIRPHVLAFGLLCLPVAGILVFLPDRPARLLVFAVNASAFACFRLSTISAVQSFRLTQPEATVVIRPWNSGLGWVVLAAAAFVLFTALFGYGLGVIGVPIPE